MALVVEGEWVLTMDPERTMRRDGAVAIAGDRIVDVVGRREAARRWPQVRRIGGTGTIVTPGLVNAHQHLTGDRLIRSAIPDTISSRQAIFDWAVPIHAAHNGDDDELSATIALVDAALHGVTFTVEAGTVAHPERVLAAYDHVGVGGTLGSWGSDAEGLPFAGDVGAVVARQQTVLDLTAGHRRVHGWVTLVGHDLMSDELARAASELAATNATGFTFHMSPTPDDGLSWLGRTGERPLVHLERLGVLGPHVVVAHAVHIDGAEVDALLRSGAVVVTCPWAYLRLGQGVTVAGRHHEILRRGGRLAVGCDSENAGDSVDVLGAAALAIGLVRDHEAGRSTAFVETSETGAVAGDREREPIGAHQALELATIAGAEAIGMGHELGSLEPAKRADVVVFDATGPPWMPPAGDPVLSLVWGAGASAVRDVVAGGQLVVVDGRCVTVDVADLHTAVAARDSLFARSGIHPTSTWPTIS